MFLRLAHCNLTCSWCDTPYSWDWKQFDVKTETERLTLEEIRKRVDVDPLRGRLVVITGGEPMMYQKIGLLDLIDEIRGDDCDWRFEIETNGTIEPVRRWPIIAYNVSPKLENSGIPYKTRINIPVLQEFAIDGNSTFKFVAEGPACLGEIAEIIREAHIRPDSVWLMPQGQTAEEIDSRTRWIAEAAIREGYNFSDRLHIRAWGTERGH